MNHSRLEILVEKLAIFMESFLKVNGTGQKELEKLMKDFYNLEND